MPVNFTTPIALILLFAMPYFVWLGWPRTTKFAVRRWRDWVSLGLRLMIVALVTFSLAGTLMVRTADELAVVFLVDASDSISPNQAAQAEEFVRTAIETM